MVRPRLYLHALWTGLLMVSCAAEASKQALAESGDLGIVDFPTSGSPAAQAFFLRGIKLLHSFEYAPARAAFHEAQEIEPDFAMAYWGEAMTHYAPLWDRIDREDGRRALGKLATRPEARRAKAKSAREKAYFDAIEVLFGDGSTIERSRAFARSMASIETRFPDDLEATTFHALAHFGIAGGSRDHEIYGRAADLAERVFTRNPRHPGAAHYLIHATDDPKNARRGLDAARAYGRIAPASPHALHMPAHIFLPLGLWAEAAAANEASIASAAPGSSHANHAYPWLMHAYVQLGRYRDARQLLDEVADRGAGRDSRAWRFMRTIYVVESETCPDALVGDDAPRGSRPGDDYARGVCAVLRGDLAGARVAAASIGDGWDDATLLRNALEARILLAEGDSEGAVAAARNAVEAEGDEDFTRDEYGPGAPLVPPAEALGRTLLAAGRVREAYDAFRDAEALRPNRPRTLLGLIRTARDIGEDDAHRRYSERLEAVWRDADTEARTPHATWLEPSSGTRTAPP